MVCEFPGVWPVPTTRSSVVKMKRLSLILSILICCAIVSCNSATQHHSDREGSGVIKYARLLTVIPEPDCTIVEIRTTPDAPQPVVRYALVNRDSTLSTERINTLSSDGIETRCISVPIKNMVVYSSVYAGPLKELGQLDVVKGVSDAEYFKLPEIKQGLSDGKITDIGPALSPSAEKIVDMGAEAVMITLYEGMEAPDPKAGNAVTIKMADTLEDTPLGRAEWIRFLGMLTGTQSLADSIFNQVEIRYTELARQGHSTAKKPKVMVENMYQGVWSVPAGASYAACMLADAGADYPWANIDKNGSLPLSYEEVFARCSDADFWLMKLYDTDLTHQKLIDMDKRYGAFDCVSAKDGEGGVYYANTKTSYLFEEFPFHPELMLADYLGIFHPELPGAARPLRYFKCMQ